jgi:hypothetical protein
LGLFWSILLDQKQGIAAKWPEFSEVWIKIGALVPKGFCFFPVWGDLRAGISDYGLSPRPGWRV